MPDNSIEQQLEVERDIARRLLAATAEERERLYGPSYNALYEMALTRRGETAEEQAFGAGPDMIPVLLRLSTPGDDVLEVGCGCGYLSLELAKRGRRATGIDVSAVAIAEAKRHAAALGPDTAAFRAVDGMSIPFPDGSFDLVFSVEVVEHLHEQDVPTHFREALRVLRPGGRLWVQTPNRLLQISVRERFAGDSAMVTPAPAAGQDPDVHLKEWTYREILAALQAAGFHRLTTFWHRPQLNLLPEIPAGVKSVAEAVIAALPHGSVRRHLLYQSRIGEISVVARKPAG